MNKQFLLELANLLERHKVVITSPNDSEDENKVFSHVEFRSGKVDMFPSLRRSHVSPYDLRCTAGMTSTEANHIYKLNKRLTSTQE